MNLSNHKEFLVCIPGILAPLVGLFDVFLGPFGTWNGVVQNLGYLSLGIGVMMVIAEREQKNVSNNLLVYNHLVEYAGQLRQTLLTLA